MKVREVESEIDVVKKQFILIYSLIILITELSFLIAFWPGEPRDRYLAGISVFFQLFVISVSRKFSFSALKPAIPIYILFWSFLFFIRFIASANMWILVSPITIYVLFQNKTMTHWCIYLFALGLLSLYAKDIFSLENTLQADIGREGLASIAKRAYISKFLNYACVFIYLCFSLYYAHKIHRMEIHLLEEKLELYRNQYRKTEQKIKLFENDDEKYNDLYNNILTHFETKKPYINPDFDIAQLAIALNSNSTYISKAIKMNRDLNFNAFVNAYRLEKIKEMIQENNSKFTLEYIYASSGFKNQSTFNKVFKSAEGITPSEYYKKYKPL
jgi:AraC-like DNA-binding protein